MPNIRQKITKIMHTRDGTTAWPLSAALAALSRLYATGQKVRAGCYGRGLLAVKKLPCKVISVGNITVGGTGKTPMTIYLAQKLQQAGARVAIISRGYKGSAESVGGSVSDGQNLLMNSDQAGDEPYLIASCLKNIPVVVGKNRFEAGRLALRNYRPDVILLDDAFQHLKLKRDIDIVLLDYSQPFGNGYLLPRGTLREAPEALQRASVCIATRAQAETGKNNLAEIKAIVGQTPIFRSFHEPYVYMVKSGVQKPLHEMTPQWDHLEVQEIQSRKPLGFSGIARNDDFQLTVNRLGFNPVVFREFSDHHRYVADELDGIIRSAEASGANCLITTDKDYVRFAGLGSLTMDLIVVGVRMNFAEDEQDLLAFIQTRLQQ